MNQLKKVNYPFSKLACIAFFGLSILVVLNLGKYKKNRVINYDISGYYLYLPAQFVYHDIGILGFYERMDSIYIFTEERGLYGIFPIPETGRKLNKYTCGVALFELPGFFVAHTIAQLSAKHPADGYSLPYQLALQLSTVVFSFLALLLLSSFLARLGFGDLTTALVIFLLGFGTNFYFYSAFEQGMSHNFSFFLVASSLYLVERLRVNPNQIRYFILFGLCSGLMILIRPIDILLVMIPFCWLILSSHTLQFWWIRKGYFLLAAVFAFLVQVPQLLYWKYITGNYWIYSYQEEGFDFLNPHILDGLFSYGKGWFVYTPIALVGVLALLISLGYRKFKIYSGTVLIVLAVYIYIVFSWYMWYYGGSFGSRVMINFLPFLAIPLALLVSACRKIGWKYSSVMALLLSFFIFLNMFQTWQYSHGIIHYSDMNKEYYWRVFLQTKASATDKELLETSKK